MVRRERAAGRLSRAGRCGRPGVARLRRREARLAYAFVSPWLIGFVGLLVVPLGVSAYLSLTDFELLGGPAEFVGLDNYRRAVVEDEAFRAAMRVTVVFVLLVVPLDLLIGLGLALLLDVEGVGSRLLRTLYFAPVALTGVAGSLVWLWVLEPSYGLVNTSLAAVGVGGPDWLVSSDSALVGVALITLWTSVGRSMLITLAALRGVPAELLDAARVEGAGRCRRLLRVTLPLITPALFFNVVLGIITNFQVFVQVLVTTGGGPGRSTLVYVLYLYRNAFEFFRLGYASALAWILLGIVLAFTLLLFGSARFWVHYEIGPRA